MVSSSTVKDVARHFGANLVGIASIDRFEGARGCMRACMIHLEQQGGLTNRFCNPFRTRPRWRLKSTAK